MSPAHSSAKARRSRVRSTTREGMNDITYIPVAYGFVYLVVIMDWYSRHMLAWQVSTTNAADFRIRALKTRLRSSAGSRCSTLTGACSLLQSHSPGHHSRASLPASLPGCVRHHSQVVSENVLRWIQSKVSVGLSPLAGGPEMAEMV